MAINKSFWKKKRVFLTGHTGFKGSWLSLWLKHLGADVTGFALAPPTQPNMFEIAKVATGMRSINGDIRDSLSTKQHLLESKPDIVIHMAAQPLVRNSYANPVETYAVNVMGLVHVLEAVRHASTVRAVVVVTSDKCYENKEWIWGYRETDPMGGYDPYSSSKGCAELVSSCYRSSFFSADQYRDHGVAVATVRAGNVIGGGDWASDRLVPDMVRAIQAFHPVEIRNPKSIRPWQHVLDPLNGYLLLAERLVTDGAPFGEAWNFGPEEVEVCAVSQIVADFAKAWGEGATWRIDGAAHPHEAYQLRLDCSKSRGRLQWKPIWGIDETVKETVQWYKAYDQGKDMFDLTVAQIDKHQSRVAGSPL